MELTTQQIQEIDTFITKCGVKHIDVRVELLDHIISSYEVNDTGEFETFLKSKKSFIINFNKERIKTIHWSIQKQLWKQFSFFFYKVKHLLVTIIVSMVTYYLVYHSSNVKYPIYFMFFMILTLLIISYILLMKNKKLNKLNKLLYYEKMNVSISLPMIFMSSVSIFDSLKTNKEFIFIYVVLGVLISFSVLIEFYAKRKNVDNLYKHLLN